MDLGCLAIVAAFIPFVRWIDILFKARFGRSFFPLYGRPSSLLFAGSLAAILSAAVLVPAGLSGAAEKAVCVAYLFLAAGVALELKDLWFSGRA